MKSYHKFLSFLTCGIILSFQVSAQNQEYRFQNLTSDEGYQLNICGNIVQDKQGFIWFPGFEGLFRYDGYELKKYVHKNSDTTSLSSNTIYSLFADKDGSIWAGTFGGGLNHLNPSNGKCILYKTSKTDSLSISGDRVSTIYRDSKNRLWIATPNSNGLYGLCVFDDKYNNFRRINLGNPSESEESKKKCNMVFGILEDKDHDIFFSTWDGLFMLDHKTGQYSVHRCDTNYMRNCNNLMGSLCLDENNMLWIATWGGGIKSFDKKTKEFKTYLWNKNAGVSSTNNICKGIESKSKDELWVAILDSKGFGPLAVFNIKKNKFSFINHIPQDSKSIPDDAGAGLFKDKSDHLWITMGNKGVSMLDLNKLALPFEEVKFKTFSNLPTPSINSCWKDTTRQILYIGTSWSDGLYSMDMKTKRINHITDKFIDKGKTGDIMYSKDNQVYLSGDALKVLNLSDHSLSMFEPQPPSPLSAMIEGKNGNLWCTSGSNMLFFESNKKVWKTIPFSVQKYGSGFRFHGIAAYKDGSIWTGSDENGIFIFDPVTWQIRNIRKNQGKNPLPFNTVICLCADKKGRIWCGGVGGIAIYNPKGNKDEFTIISSENGMTSDCVTDLAMDRNGFIWASTFTGLTKVDPETFSVTNYESLSGIFKKNIITSLDITSDYEIFVGSEMGFSHFYPEQLTNDVSKSGIVISSFKIFDKEFALPLSNTGESLKLDYDQNYFSFEFASLSFSDVDKNHYTYMLEGFDKDWIHSGTRRFAAYTNIPGGQYAFHVKTINTEGKWDQKGLSIPLFISTPWWKTIWFYLFLTFVFAGVVYGLYTYRIRQFKAIFAIRNNLAADLHDEVGSSLSNIQLLSEMLPSGSLELKGGSSEQKIIQQIRENARGTLEGMYDIIWNLNPKNDQVEFLMSRLKEQTIPFAETKNILLDWDTQSLNKSMKLSLEKRKDLYLTCKEGIQNALKYSECTTLCLKAATENQLITITINDNGRGFTTASTSGGNGLPNMKQRMERWNGHCEIFTSDKGTSVKLVLPV